MRRKKLKNILLILLVLIGSFFTYVSYKKKSLENNVIEYVTTKQNVPKNDILSSEPFISNLKGDKNFMVSIKLKNDNKIYFYYQNDDNKIILESYTEDGIEHIIDKQE
jgi:hypothetical protein